MSATRAPRNRTLVVNDDERTELLNETVRASETTGLAELVGKVINQDLLDCADFIPKESVDLLILDPPYNLSKTFSKTKFRKANSKSYVELFRNWITRLRPCLKDTATIYVCADWQTSNLIFPVLNDNFIVRNRITWEREKGRGAKTNWKNCSEDIWFCTVSEDFAFNVDAVKLKKRVIAPYKDSAGQAKDWSETSDGKFRLTHASNLWSDISIPFWSMPENTDHPTQKPEKLIAKLILASSDEGDLILDPFLGSGTTAVVAKKLDRRFIAVEQEADYCTMAVKRLRAAEHDRSIQGYHQGFFWERNSLAQQKKAKPKAVVFAQETGQLFDE